MNATEHSAHEDHRLHHWLLGISAAAGAFSLTPYVLPALGIGRADAAESVMHVIGAPVTHPYGSGLAATLQGGLASVPLIGGALTSSAPVSLLGLTVTAGTLACLAASSVVGIGGVLLANWMAKREDPNASIHWSKWIRIAALATSALIVLPGMLGALSVAITFLAGVLSTPSAVNQTAMFMRDTLGATSAHAGAMGGLSSVVSCLVSCGLGILPLGLAGMLSGKPASKGEAQSDATYEARLLPHVPCTMGQPCTLDFQLVDTKTGTPLSPDDLATMHTKKLHTMIVDSGLNDYHHLHPQYDAVRHLFTCQFTPNLQATYTMWNDFTVAGSTSPTQVKTDISVARSRALTPRISPSNVAQVGDLTFRISPDTVLRQRQPSVMTLDITGPDGQPVRDLAPIMGAYAHLAGFSADGQHFIHSHPMGEEPRNESERGVGHLQFHITPGMAGMTKFFLQVERQGRTLTVPFGQQVAPALGFANRVQNEGHSHAGMAMA